MEEIIFKVLKKMRTDYGNNEMIIFAQDSDLQIVADEIKQAIKESQTKRLILSGVSQQREMLEWLSNEDYFNIPKDEISEILEDWQTYSSSCG